MTAAFHSLTHDPRLAPYATSAAAAWLWAQDGSAVLWANASGAALFGADNPPALTEKFFLGHELGLQVIKIAETLPASGAALPAELAGAHGEAALACTASRLAIGGKRAILIVASTPVQPILPLVERAMRMFGSGSEPLAVFSGMGTLLFAIGELEAKLGGTTTLAALGAGAVMADALATGHAQGTSAVGDITVERLGAAGATVLLATPGRRSPSEPIQNDLSNTPDAAEFDPPSDNFREETAATLADVNAALMATPLPPRAAPTATPAATPEPPPAVEPPRIAEPTSELAVSLPREPQAPEPDAPPPPAPDVPEPPAPDQPAPPEPDVPEPPAPDAPEPPAPDEPAPPTMSGEPAPSRATPERRYPLRFVWTIDADERFTLVSREFIEVAGPRTAGLMGHAWPEVAEQLGLDPDGRVARAIASRDTWSGLMLPWPVADTDERINVELSGLPIFDRDRAFRGYRGFGVCRDVVRVVAPAPGTTRPVLTIVPAAENVVPFRATPVVEKRPALTPVERSAFHEIAETLVGTAPEAKTGPTPEPAPEPPPRQPAVREEPTPLPSAFAIGADVEPQQSAGEAEMRAVLERLPVGILIHHGDHLIHANRAFLEWTGYADLSALAEDGGLERLVIEPGEALDRQNGTGKTFMIATRTGETLACEGRLYTVPWDGEPVLMLVLIRSAGEDRMKASDDALRVAEAETRELRAILDAAADGVVVMDREGRVLAINRSAETLFGYGYHEMARRPFGELLAPESEHIARDCLGAFAAGNVKRAGNEPREVIGRTRTGATIPLYMTMGRVGDSGKICAVFRDISAWKRAEDDLVSARRGAEQASSAKSDFLAKISHEIRTPLNSIIGFSEVMMEERFGAIGNERYREYVKDIHASGGHLVSLINDLLDLSKIEAGRLDLVAANVNLNSLVQQCVALMQPQANQSRIIIRSSLSPALPTLMADARSVRQIVLNLLSNSIKFTGAGGQVIISTAATERGEIALRVRDTGAGMTGKEIETAMEPFRQLATSSRWGSGGTGLGLPLTKALAEANHARFLIESERDAGTLVEIIFPGARAAAE